MARARAARTLGPAWRVLRVGILAGLGLGLAVLGLRSARSGRPLVLEAGFTERGAAAARAIRDRAAVRRATDQVTEVAGELSTRAAEAADEAHDRVEEAYGRLYLRLQRVRRSLDPTNRRAS